MSEKNVTHLIDLLSQDAKASKQQSGFLIFLIIMTCSITASFLYATLVYGIRPSFLEEFKELAVQLDMVTALFFFSITLCIAFYSAIPGQEHIAKKGIMASYIGIAALVLIQLTLIHPTEAFTWHTYIPSLHCFVDVLAYALIPIALSFYFIRKAAPTDPKGTGTLAIFATLFFGYLCTQLSCSVTNHTHIFTAHIAPMLVYAGIGKIFAYYFLRW